MIIPVSTAKIGQLMADLTAHDDRVSFRKLRVRANMWNDAYPYSHLYQAKLTRRQVSKLTLGLGVNEDDLRERYA